MKKKYLGNIFLELGDAFKEYAFNYGNLVRDCCQRTRKIDIDLCDEYFSFLCEPILVDFENSLEKCLNKNRIDYKRPLFESLIAQKPVLIGSMINPYGDLMVLIESNIELYGVHKWLDNKKNQIFSNIVKIYNDQSILNEIYKIYDIYADKLFGLSRTKGDSQQAKIISEPMEKIAKKFGFEFKPNSWVAVSGSHSTENINLYNEISYDVYLTKNLRIDRKGDIWSIEHSI